MKLLTFNINEPLITKKDKKYFEKNTNKTIYIGDWCCDFEYFSDKKKVNIFDSYNWRSERIRNTQNIYIKKIYEKLLINISNFLNIYHKKNYNLKYWEILISRWLWFYIINSYSRWKIAKKILKEKRINEILSLNFNDEDIIGQNTLHSHKIMNSRDNYWSHYMFIKIFKYISKIRIKNIRIRDSNKLSSVIKKLDTGIIFFSFFNFFFKKKIFIYRLYIPLVEKILIMLKSFQLNFKIFRYKIIQSNNSYHKRNFNFKFLIYKNKFFNFLCLELKNNIPRICIEDFKLLDENLIKAKWPKKPDYIITSHGQYYDEVFKAYVAKNILLKKKFVILQHGGLGHHENNFLFGSYFEKKISDIYITWGKNVCKGGSPIGISTVKKKKCFYSKNKGILLVSYNLDIMPNKFPDGHLSNLQKQKIITEIIITFINNLSLNLRDYLFIKTNIAYTSQDQNKGDIVKNQIIKNFQNINFIENKKLTHQISHDFSIQIETFLSTGFYEALYLNNPTILIFNPKTIDGVNKNFLKELNKMHSLKISFFNASEAAQFININFKHINKWWNSKAIQDFRKIFCNKYCSDNKHFIKNLKKIINF